MHVNFSSGWAKVLFWLSIIIGIMTNLLCPQQPVEHEVGTLKTDLELFERVLLLQVLLWHVDNEPHNESDWM